MKSEDQASSAAPSMRLIGESRWIKAWVSVTSVVMPLKVEEKRFVAENARGDFTQVPAVVLLASQVVRAKNTTTQKTAMIPTI
jgi:hypothetical protein